MSGAVENCPFCGSDEVGLFRPSDYRTGANNRDWYVQCFGCHVETAEYLTEAEAVIAWNTRTTPPARSYADGLEDAARYVEGHGGVIPGATVFCSLVSGNNMPAISGDDRDRLHPHHRKAFDKATARLSAAIRLLSHSSKSVK